MSWGTFGSGCLLNDLIRYVYSGRNCRVMFVGDKAQLPPIGESVSPALNPSTLSNYGLKVYHTNLDEVVRQKSQSGILYNATAIRRMQSEGKTALLPRIYTKMFPDFVIVKGDALVESIASSYSDAGIDETIIVTRSNKRANIYNMGIRNQVLGQEERLCRGDLLMVVKNNYMVKSDGDSTAAPAFIANGDRCWIAKVRNERSLYGFEFADATLVFPDYNDFELQTNILLDTLCSEAPALTPEQQEKLYNEVMVDYADLPRKADRIAKLRNDRHYNALQVKYAYAITCHKAQGGQWGTRIYRPGIYDGRHGWP